MITLDENEALRRCILTERHRLQSALGGYRDKELASNLADEIVRLGALYDKLSAAVPDRVYEIRAVDLNHREPEEKVIGHILASSQDEATAKAKARKLTVVDRPSYDQAVVWLIESTKLLIA